jgi:general stress protein YciG
MAGNARRGFALMDPQRQKEIARKGGRAAHEKGTAHQFTPDEARAAGRKGGMVVSQHREHMVEIGRSGGRARRRRKGDVESSQLPGNEQSMSHSGPDEGEGRGDMVGGDQTSNPAMETAGRDQGDLDNA